MHACIRPSVRCSSRSSGSDAVVVMVVVVVVWLRIKRKKKRWKRRREKSIKERIYLLTSKENDALNIKKQME